jgi:ribonuclease J
MAESIGMPSDHILVPQNGRVMEFTADSGRYDGRVPADNVFVDGLGVGDIGDIVLRDRRHLSQDGVVIAVMTVDRRSGRPAGPVELISRGFVDGNDEPIMEDARKQLVKSLQGIHSSAAAEPSYIQNRARDILQKILYDRTKRRPMVLGLVVEV